VRRFHHYVVYVDGDRGFLWLRLVELPGWVDVISKTLLHAMLVGGTSIFRTERHCDVAVCAGRGDEGGHELVRLLHCDLVVGRVGIQKRVDFES
jgi:hypothetical protein